MHEGNIVWKFRLDPINSFQAVFATKEQMKNRGREQKQYVLSTSELVGPHIIMEYGKMLLSHDSPSPPWKASGTRWKDAVDHGFMNYWHRTIVLKIWTLL